MPLKPERTRLGRDLDISRIVTGLWQVADIERHGGPLDPDRAADHLEAYANDGFDTFDMADHYGSAEIIAGRLLKRRGETAGRPLAFTKWCPEPGPMTAETVRAGVTERLRRLDVARVDLLQFHWWTFEHPGWLDALHAFAKLREEGLIGEIGVTNFDAAHLHLALADGVPIVSNQVSFSLLDRRAAGPLSRLCERTGVRLLAYGTLCGGFLSDRMVGAAEPATIGDWSRMKYRRFIEEIGGWQSFQTVLSAAARIGAKHGVSVSNVATRWVLDHAAVAGVIVGARLGEGEHRGDNAKLFSFALDDEDRAVLAAAFEATKPVPGDCGDEYRKAPYLTATGDLSDHLAAIPSVFAAEDLGAGRSRVSSGSVWEPLAGYSRAVRIKDRILVSGTTATAGTDRVVASGDAGAQAVFILDKIAASLSALGGTMKDVVRTRIYLTEESDWEAVSRAHGRVFGEMRPANTMIVAGGLIGDYRVEIEAEAICD